MARGLIVLLACLAMAMGCSPSAPPPIVRLLDASGAGTTPAESWSLVLSSTAGDGLRHLSFARGGASTAGEPPQVIEENGVSFARLTSRDQVLAATVGAVPGARYRLSATLRVRERVTEVPLMALETTALVPLDPPPHSLTAVLTSKMAGGRHGYERPLEPGRLEQVTFEWQCAAETAGLALFAGAAPSRLAWAGLDLVSLQLERAVDLRTIARLGIGGEFRRAQLLPDGGRWQASAVVPDQQPWLELALGLPEDEAVLGRAPCSVRITARTGGREQVLADQTLDPRREEHVLWQPLRIDLATLAGREVTLACEAHGPNGAHVAIGEPMLVSEPSGRTPNVVLISIDTLRADRLSCYGNDRTSSPTLDAFAAQAVQFAEAQSHANYTLASHATMLSGQTPTVHGVLEPRSVISHQDTRLLAEELSARGYVTAAFTGGGFVHPRFGFARGFDRYVIVDPLLSETDPRWRTMPDDGGGERNALLHRHYRMPQVLDWLHEHRALPFFLFLHTFRVHNYAPREEKVAALARESGSALTFAAVQDLLQPDNPSADALGAGDVALLSGIYDATVTELDAELAALFAALERDQLYRNTIVVVTADHGEEFREHGHLFHGRSLYQEMLHVPLIVRVPGVAPARVATPVGLVDLVPTLLDLLGLEPLRTAQGRSLRPLFHHEEVPPEPLLAEHRKTGESWGIALRIGDRKVLHFEYGGQKQDELFLLGDDPHERENRWTKDPNAVRFRESMLARYRDQLEARARSEEGGELPPDVLAMLKALGYTVPQRSAAPPKPK